MRIHRTVLLALTIIACARLADAQDAATTAPPKTLALLVGINEYASKPDHIAPPSLRGPENDIDRAERLLVDRFGFAPDSILVLKGPMATHERIVRRFHSHLIERAGPDTRVVFWFSGHGSRTPDASGRDPSERGSFAMDETLVAFDSRAVSPYGGYDITDDELHSLLRALPAKDVLFVTDCCHAGGLLRGAPDRPSRTCPPGTMAVARAKLSFWPAIPFLDDGNASDLDSVIHIAACEAGQEAGEEKVKGDWYGTLTWHLANTLDQIDAQASWNEVGWRTRAAVATHGSRPAQRVQIVGDGSRTVLGGSARPLPNGYVVDCDGSPYLWVGAGRIHGLSSGTELQLVGLDGTERGTAIVGRVKTSSCTAEWQGKRTPKGPLRAVPMSPGEASSPLRIALADGVDPSLLRGCPTAVQAENEEESDATLAVEKDRLVLREDDRALRRMPADRLAVHRELFREYGYRSLWGGVCAPGRYRVEVEVRPLAAKEAKRRKMRGARVLVAGAVVDAGELDPDDRSTGGLVRILVTNPNDEDLHVALLSVTENREVHVLHGRSENNVLSGGETLERDVWVGRPAGWPDDRPLIDRYIAIATPRYADFGPFESEAPLPAENRGAADPTLPPFLGAVLGDARTRGDMANPAWGIGFLDLKLVTPGAFDRIR